MIYSQKVRPGIRRRVRNVLLKLYRIACRLSCVRCPRPAIAWREMSTCALDEMYSFYDETSADVVARHARQRPCPPSMENRPVAYAVVREGDAFCFKSKPRPLSWIYLSSSKVFPPVYALEFTYVPHTEFREFFQVTFAGEDLDNRHRFVIRNNACVEYEQIWRSLWAMPVPPAPLRLPLHEAATIRVEVDGNTFSFLVNGKEVLTVCDRLWHPRPTVGKLIFWNHNEPVEMDFELGRIRFLIGAGAAS